MRAIILMRDDYDAHVFGADMTTAEGLYNHDWPRTIVNAQLHILLLSVIVHRMIK